jgi:hypothetical protein
VSSESPPPSVPEGQPDSRAALLERAWGLVESGLLTQAARIFQEVHLTLARSGKDDLVRLGRELALQIGAVAHAYRAAARAGHERAVGVLLGSQKTASAAAPGSGLSLMGLDESDISGRVEQASARLRDLVLDPWMDLAGRLQTLAGGALAEGELPLSPGLFVQAAADGLGLGGEAPLALVRGLPAALAPDLTATYEAISRMLAESGVEARAVARAAPVLRPSGPATMHRPVPPTIHRDASGTLEDPLLGVDIEAASAPARRAGAGRAVPVIDHEVPEQQPDAWGLREYVRLQALFGVNASVLFDSAMQRLQDGPETAGIVRDAPSRALIGAMIAAQKLDAAHVGGLQRRSSSAGAEGKGAPAVPGQAAAADAPLKSNDAAGQEPLGTREYSRRLIGLAALPVHKHTVHLVARIFARVERDRIVPEAVRAQLVALRFPFMEAALADPSIFVRPEHAARGLINTIASSSVNWSADAPAGRRYLQQVRTTVQYILGSPGAAAGAFTQAQEQFSAFVAEQARLAGDAPLASAREALRAAEEREGRALEVGAFLRDLLAGAPLDPDLRQFLVRDWARVLVEATEGESEQPGLLQRMLSVIPDLVWSVQPVTSAPERKRFADVVPRDTRQPARRGDAHRLVRDPTQTAGGSPAPGARPVAGRRRRTGGRRGFYREHPAHPARRLSHGHPVRSAAAQAIRAG